MTLRVLITVIGCAVFVPQVICQEDQKHFAFHTPSANISFAADGMLRQDPETPLPKPMPRWFNCEETSRSEPAAFSRPYRISPRSRRNKLSRCGPTKRTLIRKLARWKCEGMFVSTFGTTRSRASIPATHFYRTTKARYLEI
jgi:hypothetical protein